MVEHFIEFRVICSNMYACMLADRYVACIDRWVTTDSRNHLHFWDLETEHVGYIDNSRVSV